MKILLTFLLAGATLSGYAQHLPPTPPPVAQTHADSAEAIHQAFRYFRSRERRGLALVSAGGIAQTSALGFSSAPSTPFKTTLSITSGVVYATLLTDYIVTLTKFSKRREAAALQRFELHQPQPQLVQRMLVAYTLGKRKL